MTAPDDPRPAMSREELGRLFDDLGVQHGYGAPPAADHLPAAGRPPAPPAPAAARAGERPTTSDLTIDEALLLHSAGWEARDLVIGAAVVAIPGGTFTWAAAAGALGGDPSARPVDGAARSVTAAVQLAAGRLQSDAARAGAEGVIGVHVELAVHATTAHATLVGTAVAPAGGGHRPAGAPWVSDLSVRDFCLLRQAGWRPLGLAFGSAFVQAPYRSVRQALGQARQNVELTNLTDALYAARERAMARMQEQALALGAGGVVAVQVVDAPMAFASHAVQFTAWGTAIRLGPGGHTRLAPRVVVDLDDRAVAFDLRGAMGDS